MSDLLPTSTPPESLEEIRVWLEDVGQAIAHLEETLGSIGEFGTVKLGESVQDSKGVVVNDLDALNVFNGTPANLVQDAQFRKSAVTGDNTFWVFGGAATLDANGAENSGPAALLTGSGTTVALAPAAKVEMQVGETLHYTTRLRFSAPGLAGFRLTFSEYDSGGNLLATQNGPYIITPVDTWTNYAGKFLAGNALAAEVAIGFEWLANNGIQCRVGWIWESRGEINSTAGADWGTNVTDSLGTKPEDGADVTGNHTAMNIVGQGTLAVQNTADFATDVSGAAKPEDNATVGAKAGTDLVDESNVLIGDLEILNSRLGGPQLSAININSSMVLSRFDADRPEGWYVYAGSIPTYFDAARTQLQHGGTQPLINALFRLKPGTTYTASIRMKATSAITVSFRFEELNNDPLDGVVAAGFATGIDSEVGVRDNITVIPPDASITTSFQVFEVQYTVPHSNAKWAGFSMIRTSGTGDKVIDWVAIRDDATKNEVTSGIGMPNGGLAGDLYFQTDIGAWWANVSGTWSKASDLTGSNTAMDIVGQGALSTQNTADFATDVSGAAKPADNATVGATAGTDLRDQGSGILVDLDILNSRIAGNSFLALNVNPAMTISMADEDRPQGWYVYGGAKPSYFDAARTQLLSIAGNPVLNSLFRIHQDTTYNVTIRMKGATGAISVDIRMEELNSDPGDGIFTVGFTTGSVDPEVGLRDSIVVLQTSNVTTTF